MTDLTPEAVKAALDGATPSSWRYTPTNATYVNHIIRDEADCGVCIINDLGKLPVEALAREAWRDIEPR